MKQVDLFLISKFTNPSGEIVFRVSGWLNGKRVRKNFPTRAEAEAERQILEIQGVQGATGIRTAATRLTESQLQDAETAFGRLKGKVQSLEFCVEYVLANYRPPEREKPLNEAVAEYLLAKTREKDRGIISSVQVKSINKELFLLQEYFPQRRTSDLTAEILTTFCDRGKPSLKTFNNRRGILSTLFKYAFRNNWVSSNPVERMLYHRIAHRRGSANTLTLDQARELMAFVERHEGGRLVPFFALCLFGGIRPCLRNGEILKLKPSDVRLDTGVILIEPGVSKVRMKRNITIQPNLAAWLRAYPLDKFPIIPRNLQRLRAAVAKKFDLSHDVMRHTFVSMFVAKFRSMGEAALQAGNSESIIRKHYLDLKSLAEANQFFNIMPTNNLNDKASLENVYSSAAIIQVTKAA